MQIWPAAAAAAAAATCTSRTHRESVFPSHDRQHSDGETSLRHVQGLIRTGQHSAARRCEIVSIANTFARWKHKTRAGCCHSDYYRFHDSQLDEKHLTH